MADAWIRALVAGPVAVLAVAVAASAAPVPATVPFRVDGPLVLRDGRLEAHVVATQATRVSIRVRPTDGRTALFTGLRALRPGDTTVHLVLTRAAQRRIRRLSRPLADVRLTGLDALAGQVYDAPAVPIRRR